MIRPGLRGTGFGMFNLATGFALLLASVIAGALWDAHGPQAHSLPAIAVLYVAGLGFTDHKPEALWCAYALFAGWRG
jgi:hypothetical protein